MAVVCDQRIGAVRFECPWCGRRHRRVLYAPEEPIDVEFGDVLVGPPCTRFTCACGADLLIIGDPEDFDVIWCNKKLMLLRTWLRSKPKIRPRQGGYYDLVRVPHGHIPVTKLRLWRRLPIPVREIRGDDYFRCPECGSPSFFKIDISCRNCAARGSDSWLLGESILQRWQNRDRRDYFRMFLKRLECLVLPVLVLAGKAWYVRSERRRWQREP